MSSLRMSLKRGMRKKVYGKEDGLGCLGLPSSPVAGPCAREHVLYSASGPISACSHENGHDMAPAMLILTCDGKFSRQIKLDWRDGAVPCHGAVIAISGRRGSVRVPAYTGYSPPRMAFRSMMEFFPVYELLLRSDSTMSVPAASPHSKQITQ